MSAPEKPARDVVEFEVDDVLDAHVRRLVGEAPPLAPGQRDRLRGLLRPVVRERVAS